MARVDVMKLLHFGEINGTKEYVVIVEDEYDLEEYTKNGYMFLADIPFDMVEAPMEINMLPVGYIMMKAN